MKILEILLPAQVQDRSLSPQRVKKIRDIQQRMNQYVDAIYRPGTSAAGKEFLKSRLRNEVRDLRTEIGELHRIAETTLEQFEVYDRRTGDLVSGPYSTMKRARAARDRKDLEYGAVRYGVRPAGAKPNVVSEAVHRVPLVDRDFDSIKTLFEHPIPAGIAHIYVQGLIEDDELFDQFESIDSTNPGQDVRPLIVEWIKRVMPDQMYRFGEEQADLSQTKGILSPIHGYDPEQYRGTNDPITGNAFGFY
jgi:hypothetical protein